MSGTPDDEKAERVNLAAEAILDGLEETDDIEEERLEQARNKLSNTNASDLDIVLKEILDLDPLDDDEKEFNRLISVFKWRYGTYSLEEDLSENESNQLDDLRVLEANSQMILDLEDSIRDIIRENTKNVDHVVEFSLITERLTEEITRECNYDSLSNVLAGAILRSAANAFDCYHKIFKDYSKNNKIYSLINELNIKHEAEIQYANRLTNEGDHFVKAYNIDVVKRSHSGSIGLNHNFRIHQEGNVQITAGLGRSLGLVAEMMSGCQDAIETHGENATQTITREGINDLVERVSELERVYDKYDSEGGSS